MTRKETSADIMTLLELFNPSLYDFGGGHNFAICYFSIYGILLLAAFISGYVQAEKARVDSIEAIRLLITIAAAVASSFVLQTLGFHLINLLAALVTWGALATSAGAIASALANLRNQPGRPPSSGSGDKWTA